MGFVPFAVLAVGLAVLARFLSVRDRKGSVRALLLKTLTSLLFLGVAFSSFLANRNQGVFHALVIMGLACGLAGDIILDLKVMYPDSSRQYQGGGMAAFAAGHLFYISALVLLSGFSWIAVPAGLAVGLAVFLSGIFLFGYDYGKDAALTCAYSLVLSLMTVQACFSAFENGFAPATALFAFGGVLFLLSDLVLGMTYYGGKDAKPFIAVNHVLYYLAQFSIALSVLYARF